MDTALDRALPLGRDPAPTAVWHAGRLATVLIAAVPFVVAWIGLVTTAHGHMAWYADEDGLAENLQVVFLLLATGGAAAIARAHWRRADRALGLAYAVFAAGCFFVAGEEISWGQRLLGIETPETVAAHNIQHEITLHNTFLFTPIFSLAQLVVGLAITLAALTPWALLLPARLDVLRRALVPGPALAGYFAMTAAWRLYRYVGVTAATPAWVGELSEVPELVLYLGLALFTYEQWRRLHADVERPVAQPSVG